MQFDVIEQAALVLVRRILKTIDADIDAEHGDVVAIWHGDVERRAFPSFANVFGKRRGLLPPEARVWIVTVEIA